jgi:hypothetical protein
MPAETEAEAERRPEQRFLEEDNGEELRPS